MHVIMYYINVRYIRQIAKYLDRVCSDKTQTCEIINIGKSYEGRDLKVIKVINPHISNNLLYRVYIYIRCILYVIH